MPSPSLTAISVVCALRDMLKKRRRLWRLAQLAGVTRLGRIVHNSLAFRCHQTRVPVIGYPIRFTITEEADLHHAESMNGEEAFLGRMVDACLPGDVFYDVGSYLGKFSVLVALAKKSEDVRVHAFEPVARNYEILVENARINGVGNAVRTHQVALGRYDHCVAHATMVSGDFSQSRISSARSGEDATPVRLVTMDWIASQTNEPPSVVKIDVEGMEMDVLAGARVVLTSAVLHDLFLEVHPEELCAAGRSVEDLHTHLERFGLRCVWSVSRRGQFLEHYQR